MIFATVGTSSWDFTRLIKEMDDIAGRIDEEVVIQIGTNEYTPNNAQYFRFDTNERIDELYSSARVVVSHAGVGCIISAMKYEKPNIVVPRRAMYHEHFDDHQVEIASELENEGKIIVAWHIEDLGKLLVRDLKSIHEDGAEKKLVTALKNYIITL